MSLGFVVDNRQGGLPQCCELLLLLRDVLPQHTAQACCRCCVSLPCAGLCFTVRIGCLYGSACSCASGTTGSCAAVTESVGHTQHTERLRAAASAQLLVLPQGICTDNRDLVQLLPAVFLEHSCWCHTATETLQLRLGQCKHAPTHCCLHHQQLHNKCCQLLHPQCRAA